MIRTAPRRFLLLPAWVWLAAAGCSNGDSGGVVNPPAGPAAGTREHRAIAGVSMGGYAALNLGTKHPDRFGAIGSLGGPVDLEQLLADIQHENLEVKLQTEIPSEVGDDFTFDHFPPYPDRETRIGFTRDLVLAFGNPFLHHPDPARAYLASDSQPAQLRVDDAWGAFTVPVDPSGFADGGDANEDGLRQTSEPADEPVEVLLVAQGSLQAAFGLAGADFGGRQLADPNGDGIFDVGDGLVLNFSEPFSDGNANGRADPGEPFTDAGLDGVAATGDFGEGNAVFDRDPDIARWLAEDPRTRVAEISAADIQRQRIYMDVGSDDELGFARHYANVLNVLTAKGITVEVHNGFPGNCAQIPDLDAPYTLVQYDGGHVGFGGVDTIVEDLRNGDVCGPATIWQRLLHLLVAIDAALPNPDRGTGGVRPFGDTLVRDIASPALAVGGAAPLRRVVVYRPPAALNTDRKFPILYFMGGHGQSPEDYERVGALLDLLISGNVLQNLYVAFLPGEGGTEGSFFVNHAVSEAQVPDLIPVTSGRYEDSILQDLIPAVETTVLEGRVR
jgi:hypothetical protein